MEENAKERKRKNKKNKTKNNLVDVSKKDMAQDIDEEQEVDLSTKEELPHNQVNFEDDSDTEEQPKRKKKKKQPIPTESDSKKGKKSKRQIKKEKFIQRQAEAQAASKDQLKTQCLTYLSQWKHDKQNWKFMKVKQVWLFKNKFNPALVPDASWPQLLEYFDSAQGNIRNMLLDDANKIIKQLDEWSESQNKETNDTEEEVEVSRPDDNVYKRARDLIQCLQE
ncbi:uncharacterized protein [Choristoneura fumiferana]|uniref:uncharacterized protein n=1 Tax=Choristoneura fumiferana TaxID=7141 RepID=UPI003D15788E